MPFIFSLSGGEKEAVYVARPSFSQAILDPLGSPQASFSPLEMVSHSHLFPPCSQVSPHPGPASLPFAALGTKLQAQTPSLLLWKPVAFVMVSFNITVSPQTELQLAI